MSEEYDGDKFRELVLYLAECSVDDAKFGKTKLAKLLFFSDFYAYGQLGKPITGAVYGKYPHGPVPRALSRELRVIEEKQDGVVAVSRYHDRDQQRVVALREADLSKFTAAEISLVDEVIRALTDHDAASVSRLSHLEAGWQCLDDYADIPYDMVFVSTEPLSQETVTRGQQIAERHGLLIRA